MKILLLNPPHPSIGSRIPHEHLPPLGLLSLGGPLIDGGHAVTLLDAEFGPLSVGRIVAEAIGCAPDAVLLGHSGSTSGHPIAMEITRALRAALPATWIVYGGVFPTFHWREIMDQEPQIDFIVRGEGEQSIVRLVQALESRAALSAVPGLVFRTGVSPAPTRNPGAGELRSARIEDGGSRMDSGKQGLTTERAGVRASVDSISLLEHGFAERVDPEPSTDPFRPTLASFHRAAGVAANPLPPPIADLDSCRVGWELIDHARYTYWGDRRAVVVQFSRGCPHQCRYCGQREFWRQWRHRDPVKFAAELARLHRDHGVEVINFADENPTASRQVWRRFLEALIAENVPLILVGSTRAGDIVRDADILHLYKRAGVARFLLGIESTNAATLEQIRKGSTQTIDREAIRLLRRHGIIAMAAIATGLADETDLDYWRTLRQVIAYDPDQIQAVYATPHRWTPFAQGQAGRRVIQTDLRRWDYKHQVLASERVPNWRVLFWMKLIEAVAQLRPKSIFRLLAHPDPAFRAAMRWYYRIGRRVWPYELWNWCFRDRRTANGPVLAEFLGMGKGEAQCLRVRFTAPPLRPQVCEPQAQT